MIRAAIAGSCPHYPDRRIADVGGRLRSARSRSIGRSGFFSASVRPNGLLSKSVASWDVGCIRDVDEPSVMSRI
jgi:hypothetical protein